MPRAGNKRESWIWLRSSDLGTVPLERGAPSSPGSRISQATDAAHSIPGSITTKYPARQPWWTARYTTTDGATNTARMLLPRLCSKPVYNPPGALLLLSPWSDVSGRGDSHMTLAASDPVLTSEDLKICADAYAAPTDQQHPYVSPVYGDYSKPFPPTLIQGGTRELLLSDFVRHYRAILTGGNEAILDLYEGMQHAYHTLPGDAPEIRETYLTAARFWRARLC
jgi:hypothetical protein